MAPCYNPKKLYMKVFFRCVQVVLVVAIILSAAFGLASLSALHKANQVLCKNCNVILISIDTLGAKHTSVYDPTLDTTPYLKQLADSRGVVFDHAYDQAPWTLPSHTSMFTGEYPWTFGIWTLSDKLPDSAYTVFEAARDRGYKTAGFSDGSFVQPINGLTQGIDDFSGSFQESDWNDLPVLFVKAAKWITEYHEPKPFFLLLRPFEVHDPYGEPGTAGAVTIEDIVAANTKPGGPTADDIRTFEAAYHQEIRITDSALKDFMTSFDASPYAKNTVIIITADHGEEFGEHGTVAAHGITTYNEVIHVPLIFIIPGVAPRRVVQTVELRSIPATIMDIIGYGKNNPFQASSLVPMLIGDPAPNQLVLTRTASSKSTVFQNVIAGYAEIANWGVTVFPTPRIGTYDGPYTSSALRGQWHVIRDRDGSLEVYDLSNDPDEKKNLYPTVASLPFDAQQTIKELILVLNPLPTQ